MSDITSITVTDQLGLELVNPKLRAQHDSLVREVSHRLSPQHAFLFARPEKALDGDGARTAWFMEGLGNPVPLSSLPPEQQNAIAEHADRLRHDVAVLAMQLKSEGAASAELGKLLDDALVLPPGNNVWVDGTRPILINWGCRQVASARSLPRAGAVLGEGTPTFQKASAQEAGASDPMPPTGIAAKVELISKPSSSIGGRRALVAALWILFCGLLLVSADRLLRACSVAPDWLPTFIAKFFPEDCRDPQNGEMIAAILRAQDELRRKEMEVILKAATCTQPAFCPAPAQLTPTTPPALLPRSDLPADIDIRVGQAARGALELDLIWEGRADLDLALECPDRTRILYNSKNGCSARLEIDENAAGSSLKDRPIEHIIWDREDSAPAGEYKAYVTFYDARTAPQVNVLFKLVLSRRYTCNGRTMTQIINSIEGTAAISQLQVPFQIMAFKLPLEQHPSCSR